MSIALATAMRSRLEAQAATPGSALGAWVAEHGELQVVLGYRRPTGAQGWPFVALWPARDRRDLRSGRGDSAEVAMVCGVRLEQVERGDAVGPLAVDALAEAVLAALGLPWMTTWAGREWDARSAERVAAEFSHPMYELECAVTFGRVGIE